MDTSARASRNEDAQINRIGSLLDGAARRLLERCDILRVFSVSLMVVCAPGCVVTAPVPVREKPQQLTVEPRQSPWLLIDSARDELVVHREEAPPLVFKNIAFGAAGVKDKSRRGDDVTPRGTYRVAWIRRQSKFERFIGLNYPSLEDARRGFESGRIDRHTFERIRLAHARGEVPPQDTPLGGFIGIHGVGKGSLDIHRVANWTGGCVAVENHQIHRLLEIVTIGTVVEIR